MERPVARLDLDTLTRWITAAAIQHPKRLDLIVAERAGVGKRLARRVLRRLVERHWLVDTGTARKPFHRPGLLRQVVHTYALEGLQEDQPWARDFAPFFLLPGEVNTMVQHSFCELLNNAIEHSGGTHVTVSIRQTASHVQLLVSDDGKGLFQRIAETSHISDVRLAMFELSKGKFTSQPQIHSGQGLFFTSKLADVFDLHANETAFQQREWDGRGWWPRSALKRQGTSVYVSILLDTKRTLDSVRRTYSVDARGAGFDRTIVPLGLMTSTLSGLVSRAQARRVVAGLAAFDQAELDFDGVPEIGHAFADELFRVLAQESTRTELFPINMSPAVAAMVCDVSRIPEAVTAPQESSTAIA